MKTRSIVGRTDYGEIADLAASYLNERFPMIGAVAEESGSARDCKYLVICSGPCKRDSIGESSVVVEACRAYIAGQMQAKK